MREFAVNGGTVNLTRGNEEVYFLTILFNIHKAILSGTRTS